MSNWLPSLNALRAFECVARHLSYQTAAEELRVTPGAVKQLVSKLEASIGTPLLERSGRGLALTQSGQAGRKELEQAMRALDTSVAKMRDQETNPRLIVTVEASFATSWLVPRLEAFRSRHPRINVLIDSSQQIVDLHTSDADIAIRYGVESRKNLIVERIFDDQIFAACSPTLAAGPPNLFTVEDLPRTPLIHWDTSQLGWIHRTQKWFTWENWLSQVGANHVMSTKGLYFNDYGQAVQAAIAGQGVILASWPILRGPFDAGLLVRLFGETVTTDIGYDLVTTKAARQRTEVRAFIDWMLEEAECDDVQPA